MDKGWWTVLGGAGFLGSHLCEALAAAGRPVRVFDRPNADRRNLRDLSGQWEFMGGDFVNEVDTARAVEDSEVVFHLISTTIPATSTENPVYDVESNLVPTLRLLDQVRKARVRRVVFVSSGGTVYGRPRQLPMNEEHPTEPQVSYGLIKLTIEHYLRLYYRFHALGSTVLRLANPYGPRQDNRGAQGAASVFLARVFEDHPITIWGDGSIVRDFLYVDDAVSAMVAAGRETGFTTYNVGSGSGASLKELIAAIAAVSGKTPEIRNRPPRDFDVPTNVLDIARARRDLGWEPKTSLEEGLRRTWAWLESGGGRSEESAP